MKANKKSWCCGGFALLAGGILLVIAGLVYYFYIGPNILKEKRALTSPPSILVRSPQAGDTVSTTKTLIAQATVSSISPIARVEVWLDGEVAETQVPDSKDQTTMYTYIELELSAGPHMLSWRAVDSAGLVGQSGPIPIAGHFPPEAVETTTLSAEEGQSLQDIAEAQGVDPGLLQNLNPGVGIGGLPGGTTISVPVPPGHGGGQQPAPANAPTPPLPTPPAGMHALLLARMPLIDYGSLFPVLLSNLPAAPSHLQAGFENCTIRLVWNDTANNESHFLIWMQALGGPPLKIYTTAANPGAGQTWFEFASPGFGIYSFWVEAVNALGGQSSEIAWIAVNDAACGEGVASQLEIEALGMYGFTSGGWKDVYCFLSIEGWPEKRIPQDDSQFLEYDGAGEVDIHNWIGGRNRILIQMPADEEVTLEGDCWGWLGDSPASMGTFGVSVPKVHWDNRTLQARGTNYVIDFRIRPFGSIQAEGAFNYLDHSIPAPYGLSVDEIKADYDPNVTELRMRTPTVRWQWAGDLKDITGFTVQVDGARAAWIEPIGKILPGNPPTSSHKGTLLLPSACGVAYQIQVAANSKNAQSELSTPKEYRQLPCDYQSSIQSFPVHYLYASTYDGNELWLYTHDSGRNHRIVELVSKDLTSWVARKQDYRQSGVIYLKRLHNPADEPNVTPYYYFAFIQQKLEFGGQPIYYDVPVTSEGFAVGVNYLGSGWRLLRETMLLFGRNSYPQSRFEQIYRGPDGQLYLYSYQLGTQDLKLLQDAMNEGYGVYKLSDFD